MSSINIVAQEVAADNNNDPGTQQIPPVTQFPNASTGSLSRLLADSLCTPRWVAAMTRRGRLSDTLDAPFLADVLKLSLGTLAGRFIGFGAMPLLTRLYSPDDFGVLAAYLALVNTLAVVACLRLEIAIPLVNSDESAISLLALSLLALCGITLTLATAVTLAPRHFAEALGVPGLAPWLWLAPVGVGLAGCYSAMQSWATRNRRFGDIARTRAAQALTGVGAMLALGWVSATPLGLLLGNTLNIGAGSVSLAIKTFRHEAGKLRRLRRYDLWPALMRNRRFPLLSTPEALLNIAGVQLPILMIAAHEGAEGGFLLLAMQVLTAPMALLGNSISQVYVSRAPQELREGRLPAFTLSLMRHLTLTGTGPLLLAGAASPSLFPWIFGETWGRSGEIVGWLVPWMTAQFIASPVSMVMFVVGRQRAMLALTLLGFVLRVGFVWLSVNVTHDRAVHAFALGSVIYYILVLAFVLHAAGIGPRQATVIPAACLDRRVLAPAVLAFVLYILT